MRSIAEAAGFSQGALYSNFESKEALLLELMRLQKEADMRVGGALVSAATSRAEVINGIRVWATNVETRHADACLAIELELQAERNAEFAKAYSEATRDQLRLFDAVVEHIFAVFEKQLPAPVSEISAGIGALAHGLTLKRSTLPKGTLPRVIETFILALLEAAPPLAR